MGAAFSTEIDIDRELGIGSNVAKSGSSLGGLTEKFENLVRSIGSVNQGFGTLNKLAAGADKVLASAMQKPIAKGYELAGSLSRVAVSMELAGTIGISRFEAVNFVVKKTGQTLNLLAGGFRKLVWLFDLLSKMNPFGALSVAYDKFMKLYDKIKELSRDSTKNIRDARAVGTTAKNLRAFEKASDTHALGIDRADLAGLRRAMDTSEGQAQLAAVGLSAEKLKKMDAVDAFFEVQKAVEKQIERMGGFNALGVADFLDKTASVISPSFSLEAMRGNQGEMKAAREEYYRLKGRDKTDDAALSDFEKSWKKLSAEFSNLWGLIASKLAPALTKLTDAVRKMLEAFVDWLDSGALSRFVEVWESFIDWVFDFIKSPWDTLTGKAQTKRAGETFAGSKGGTLDRLVMSGKHDELAKFTKKKAAEMGITGSFNDTAFKAMVERASKDQNRQVNFTFIEAEKKLVMTEVDRKTGEILMQQTVIAGKK